MKRYLLLFPIILIALLCSSCSSSSSPKSYEGQWYSAKTGEMYEFYNGDILCKNNFVTLDSGEKTSGSYIIKEDCINTYVVGHTGLDTLLCIVNIDGNEALSNKETGTIYFYRDKSVAQKIVKDEKSLKNKEFIYCDSFNNNTNIDLQWEGIIAQVPYTWNNPKFENLNIASVNAEGSSTYLIKFNIDNPINNVDELFADQQTLNKINEELTNYFKEDRYSNRDHDLKHPNFKYVDNIYYKKGSHTVIKSKEVLLIKHSADYERFTTYCFAVGEHIYTWTLIERNNDINSAIKDFEKVINTIEANENIPDQSKGTENHSSTNTSNTSEINVTFSKDSINEDNMLLKVYVKNTSESKFSGNIHVYFYSADNKTLLGSDTIIVKDLMPGQQSWSNITVDKYSGTLLLEKEFTNVKFTSLDTSNNVLDDYKTEKTKNSVKLNFDIANWYKNIKSIKVYTNGSCEVMVTSSSDDTLIASSVWSCGHEYGVKSVSVIDQNGKILAVFSN